jgi:putative ABC transport system permease protein
MKDWGPPLTGEIVGVAGNVKADGLDTALRPMIYWRYTQFPQVFNNLVVRAEGDPLSVLPAVKSQIQAVDSEQAIARIRTMDEVVSGSIAPRRFNMLLLGVFAALALILAAVGIYGVVSYTTAQRTHEFGVRLALGASTGDVLKLVVGQGLTLVLIGIGIGLAAAFLLTRVMSSLLFEVTSTDPVTYVSISILLAAVALFACWIPARRATTVDPMVALRQE